MSTTELQTADELRGIAAALDRISDLLGERDNVLERRRSAPRVATVSDDRGRVLDLRCYLAACAGQLDRIGDELQASQSNDQDASGRVMVSGSSPSPLSLRGPRRWLCTRPRSG